MAREMSWLNGVVLAALAMSVGWGFRGDYGHEAGAMVPGALLGLAILIIFLAWLTVCSHDEPLPGSHLRFAQTE